MKAIGICGSPRIEGNTEFLLKTCLGKIGEAGIETELIRLAEKRVEPCRACNGCAKIKNENCVHQDDDFKEIWEKMRAADIIVVGSPVYFGSATPQIMSVLDRAGYVSRMNGNLLSRKLGGAVVVARRGGQNFTFAQLCFWFMINDMIMPGSTYWNTAFGAGRGQAAEDKEGVDTVTRFGENLAWLAKKLA